MKRLNMIRYLRSALTALLCFSATCSTVDAEEAIAPSAASVMIERIAIAKEICERQSPSFTTEVIMTERKEAVWKKVKGKKKPQKTWRTIKVRSESVTERPIVLCAWSPGEQSWHVIEIHVPYPQKSEFAFTVKTPWYRLERVNGKGLARLTFNAYRVTEQGEEKLIVYRYLHSWFSPESLERGNGTHLLDDARFVSYTPMHPDLAGREALLYGMRYLYGELMEAYRELRDAGEPSKAFPRELLVDVIDWRIPFALAGNEQMDHDKFNQDAWGTTANVYTEFALNGPETFMWSFSNFPHKGRIEHAVGAMQFTNHMGTYDGVRKGCPRAHLDPDFIRGSQNLRNSLKAAICLLDMELARLPGVHALYRSNPAVGGVYPVIAYNAGGGTAQSAYNTIRASKIDLEEVDLGVPEEVFVRTQRCKTCKKKKGVSTLKVLPGETEMYVKKYMYVLEFIEEFQSELLLPEVPPEKKPTE
jgi:hypothetical protein